MTAAFDPLDAAREQISAAMTGAVRAGEGDPAAKPKFQNRSDVSL